MSTNDVPARVPESLEGHRIVPATDFLRVVEQAALASARWVGQGNAHAADGAAVDAMRKEFSAMPITGTVIIGEGEKDEAPELYVGEVLGTGRMPGAIAVCVIGAPGGVMAAPDMYMQKLCVGAGAKGRVDIAAPIADTLDVVARCYDRRVRDLSVIVLDRPRHEELIEEIRGLGARIKLIPDGVITASMSAAVRGTGDHLYLGIGGSTEGVITAAALECLGGEIQARMWPKDDAQLERLKPFGLEDTSRVLTARDLAPDPLYVLATGVTDGYLLKGVRYFSDGARTHSILMDLRERTVRFVDTVHMFSRTPLREIRL